MTGQLGLLVFVPVALGMVARARWPVWVVARGQALQIVSWGVTVALN